MKELASFLLVAIGLIQFGSSQLKFPSRHYIPAVSYFNPYENNYYSNVNHNQGSHQSLNPYATNQRNTLISETVGPAPEVVKSVYFFESKPQDEEHRIRIRFPPAKKKTRVIFIKAPETKVVPEVIAPQPAEERTVVYVLSKKLEPLGSITIPSRLVTPVRRKPEVYYIKYRDLDHARKLLEDSLKGRGDGASVPTHDSASSFLKTLQDIPDNRLTDGATSSFLPGLAGLQGGHGVYGKPGASGPY